MRSAVLARTGHREGISLSIARSNLFLPLHANHVHETPVPSGGNKTVDLGDKCLVSIRKMRGSGTRCGARRSGVLFFPTECLVDCRPIKCISPLTTSYDPASFRSAVCCASMTRRVSFVRRRLLAHCGTASKMGDSARVVWGAFQEFLDAAPSE